MTLQELRTRRAKLISDAQALLAKETVTAEDRANFDRMMADEKLVRADIERMEAAETLAASMRTQRPPAAEPGAYLDDPAAGDARPETEEQRAQQLASQKRAFNLYLRHGAARLRPEIARHLRPGKFSSNDMREVTASDPELRDLSVGAPASGGYLVPTDFQRTLISAQKIWGDLLTNIGHITTAGGAPLQWPMDSDILNYSTLIGEALQVTNETDPTFSQVLLTPDKLSTGLVKLSREVLQDAEFDLAGIVTRSLATRMARGLNKLVTNGSTTGNIQSLMAAAVPGAVAVGTGATVDGIGYQDYVNLFGALEPAYRVNAKWMMSNATFAYTLGVVDNYGRPLFIPNVNGSGLDQILGQSLFINQDMPPVAPSAASLVFGDFSYYIQRDVSALEVLRLDERFADFGQIAFLGFHRQAGRLLDAGTHPLIKLTQKAA